jgi:hypothetical protein
VHIEQPRGVFLVTETDGPVEKKPSLADFQRRNGPFKPN